MKQIIANFVKNHMNYLEFADALNIHVLTKSSYIICGNDCRLGDWVKYHHRDLIDLGKQHNFDIHVLIEQMEQLDTSPGVYVIISRHGDKSGLHEITKMAKGREGMFLSKIESIPNFDDFIKRSELSKALFENASEVYITNKFTLKREAASSYSTVDWFLDDEEETDNSNRTESEKAEPKTQVVELTVVGIRNYCPGGKEGLTTLFKRLPVGSTLYLKVNPSGTEYPGAVAVYDGLGSIIGFISKTERRFIKPAIPKDRMLPCKIIGHSMEDLCLYVEAENSVGFEDPYIRQTSVESGELIFAMTQHDLHLYTMTHLLLTQLKSDNPDLNQILSLANEYSTICCTSLDGESSFARADIQYYLKKLNKGNGMFDNVIHRIHEDTKDLGRMCQDMKIRVYRDQYKRIFTDAYTKKGGKPSQLETYIKTLAYNNGGKLTKEVVNVEIQKLSQLLSNEFMGSFVKASETDEDFAKALYSLNYSLRAIYIMYTRRIKREYLLGMHESFIEKDKPTEVNSVVDAIREQTRAIADAAEAMKKVASKPTSIGQLNMGNGEQTLPSGTNIPLISEQ